MTGSFKETSVLVECLDEGCLAACPEFDIVSQGDTVDEACANLQEALGLFMESASDEEIERRYRHQAQHR